MRNAVNRGEYSSSRPFCHLKRDELPEKAARGAAVELQQLPSQLTGAVVQRTSTNKQNILSFTTYL